MSSNTEQKSNIVEFPREKWKTPSLTMEEVYESITAARKDHIELLVNLAMDNICNMFSAEGYDIAQDSCENNYIFVCEALDAILCKSVNIEHSLHQAADDFCEDRVIVEFEFDDEEGEE